MFRYCERGLDAGFWAEPVNAITNLAFLIAGLWCLWLWTRGRERSLLTLGMCLLMIAIAVGSFLFHTQATRWAATADTLPIALYMLLAVYVMARRFFRAPIWTSWLAVAAFAGFGPVLGQLARRIDLPLGFSVGYLPALLVLLASGAALASMRRPQAAPLLAAGAIFTVSLTARTLDRPYCDALVIGDYALGAHFLWHLLNAVTLYLVTRTALRTPIDAPRAA